MKSKTAFGEPAKIKIMRAAGWPSFLSGFCTTVSVHALERFNKPDLGELPSVEQLGEECLTFRL